MAHELDENFLLRSQERDLSCTEGVQTALYLNYLYQSVHDVIRQHMLNIVNYNQNKQFDELTFSQLVMVTAKNVLDLLNDIKDVEVAGRNFNTAFNTYFCMFSLVEN